MPPAQAPEGHAAERPIHPRGGTGNEETDGEEGVEASKACYALARSECVCTFAYSLIQGCNDARHNCDDKITRFLDSTHVILRMQLS